MRNFINTYWKTIVFFGVVGLIGGFFVGIYTLDSYPPEIQQEIIADGGNESVIGVATAIQSAMYGVFLGAAGIVLGKKTGLWKDEKSLTKKPLVMSAVVAIVGGLALILPDTLYFGKYSQAIMDSYAVKPTVPYMIATVTYGAVIEEVMLRLFTMSLVAFVLGKLFMRKSEQTNKAVLIASNIIAAMLFAAGHLPATAIIIGVSPMIVFRCFLLNGGLGLLFGYLYRKYGLRYAMLAHGGCHIISKLIWILFI